MNWICTRLFSGAQNVKKIIIELNLYMFVLWGTQIWRKKELLNWICTYLFSGEQKCEKKNDWTKFVHIYFLGPKIVKKGIIDLNLNTFVFCGAKCEKNNYWTEFEHVRSLGPTNLKKKRVIELNLYRFVLWGRQICKKRIIQLNLYTFLL